VAMVEVGALSAVPQIAGSRSFFPTKAIGYSVESVQSP
jgi:hypothetical protein